MKKLTTILLATAALLVAAVSCNKEGNEPEGRMAQLSYEVSLSEPVAKALGAEIKLASFTRFAKGEGIEKKVDDFAAEIASMVK